MNPNLQKYQFLGDPSRRWVHLEVPTESVAPLATHTKPIPHIERRLKGPERLAQIRESVERHGIQDPLEIGQGLAPGELQITDGNHRLMAARELGIPTVPVKVRAHHVDRFRAMTVGT
jgi:ParB-like chromosome segregation protein Spo0J